MANSPKEDAPEVKVVLNPGKARAQRLLALALYGQSNRQVQKRSASTTAVGIALEDARRLNPSDSRIAFTLAESIGVSRCFKAPRRGA